MAKEPETKKETIEQKNEQIKPDEKDVKIESLNKEIQELTNLVKRVQADFENYRKRMEKDNIEFVRLSNKNLIQKILPAIDNFNLALSQKHTCRDEEFIKGMELIYSQLVQMLEDEGVKEIKTLGEKFNPYRHEALLAEESDKEEKTILEELQKGYTLHDTIIRMAKVKVAKKRKEVGEIDKKRYSCENDTKHSK
jgi:molecular chaperone GrpE